MIETPREESPYSLIQEKLRDDPWKLLIACMMLNQTSAVQVKLVIWTFFEKWPTASSLVCADIDSVIDVIKPLGLYNRRAKMMISMSKHWIDGKWKDVADLPGVGKYARDSFEMFSVGYLVQGVQDKELLNYVKWANGRKEAVSV